METDQEYGARVIELHEQLMAKHGTTVWRNPDREETRRLRIPLPPLGDGRAPIDWDPHDKYKLRRAPELKVVIPPAGAPPADEQTRARMRGLGWLIGDAEGCIALASILDEAIQTTTCHDPMCDKGGGLRCKDRTHQPRVLVGGLAGTALVRASGITPATPAPQVHEALLTDEERLLARARSLR